MRKIISILICLLLLVSIGLATVSADTETADTTESGEPTVSTTPSESPDASEPVNPTESPDPSEPENPTESPDPSQPADPTESLTPSESPAPSETEEPSESPKTVFTDVPPVGEWYSEAVYYADEKGYMKGTGNNMFEPQKPVTRAQIAQILYARDEKPEVKEKAKFSDVPEKQWYTDAVAWAASKQIVAGYPDNTFKPDKAVSREELAVMLYKYEMTKKETMKHTSDVLAKFKDADKVQSYAVTAMEWAVANKLIGGTDKGLEPQGTATRAQIAVILMAYDKNIGE